MLSKKCDWNHQKLWSIAQKLVKLQHGKGWTLVHFASINKFGIWLNQTQFASYPKTESLIRTCFKAWWSNCKFYPKLKHSLSFWDSCLCSLFQDVMVIREGYPFESHVVFTEDKYILNIHRISHGRNMVISLKITHTFYFKIAKNQAQG